MNRAQTACTAFITLLSLLLPIPASRAELEPKIIEIPIHQLVLDL